MSKLNPTLAETAIAWTEDERQLVMRAVNALNLGGAPFADARTFPHFSLTYVAAVLEFDVAEAETNIGAADYLRRARPALAKLHAALDGHEQPTVAEQLTDLRAQHAAVREDS